MGYTFENTTVGEIAGPPQASGNFKFLCDFFWLLAEVVFKLRALTDGQIDRQTTSPAPHHHYTTATCLPRPWNASVVVLFLHHRRPTTISLSVGLKRLGVHLKYSILYILWLNPLSQYGVCMCV